MFVYSISKRFYNRPLIYTKDLQRALLTRNTEIKTFRLCDEEGEAVDDATLPAELTDAKAVKEIYSGMVLLASMDKLLYEAQRQGRISFYMTSSGEEATHFGSARALHRNDPIYAQYRETGVLLSRGFPLQQMLHQLTGNSEDLGKGRQMPVHYGSREFKIQTISSPLGTQLPQAVGYAYFLKIRSEGNLPICYFGEGAASEGDFHAALNMGATLKTPLIFFCRNNQYAISTPDHEQYAGDGIAARGPGYGIPSIRVDGNDLWAVYAATKEARALALRQNTPVLIEAMTYRIGHHSTSDDSTAYRPPRDPSEIEKTCPIARVRRHLQARGVLSNSENAALIADSRRRVLEALEAAEQFPKPAIENLFSDVYDILTPELETQQQKLKEHLEKYPKEYNLNEFKSE